MLKPCWAALACLLLPGIAQADPCGMVPPIFAGDGPPITRIGLQRTYVFFKDGVESIAIRPGFSGKVEAFGMLIPFPSPPALRKVADDIFPHIAASIDVPAVEIELGGGFGGGGFLSFGDDDPDAEKLIEIIDHVEVLREEAVGMYEVAVLEAGSARALQRWMEDHGFIYPEGMDGVCEEYIEAGWCFVAVKARVGSKQDVEPRPGMREAETGLQPGETFDGFVQAMGFRFHTDELVIPMRLSAFNEGRMHNVVYLLTEGAQKLRGIDSELVTRQLPGAELFDNLTQPRPVRLLYGELDAMDVGQLRGLAGLRDPGPVNGLARDLFADDLGSLLSGQLSLPHEEDEKSLLNIAERLGMRGPSLDGLHRQATTAARDQTAARSLGELSQLTLTVIDGDFPRKLLASNNLSAEPYTMPAELNSPSYYDANVCGPGDEPRGTLLTAEQLAALRADLRPLLGDD